MTDKEALVVPIREALNIARMLPVWDTSPYATERERNMRRLAHLVGNEDSPAWVALAALAKDEKAKP